jgi:SAM-dependent methyltransferase
LTDSVYTLPRTDREWRRLMLQGELLAPITRRCFQQAGIGRGMRVLDVGSGVGDVSLICAELVGPRGSVLGVELDEESNQLARKRAADRGLTNVEFRSLDIATIELDRRIDAVVGRFVLMHLKDPIQVLRRLRAWLRPGGIVAFVEPYLDGPYATTVPPSPTLAHLELVRDRLRAAGPAIDRAMGLRLHGAFVRVGLPPPQLFAEQLVGGADSKLIEYMAETMHSVSRHWVRLGIEGADRLDFETFAERVRAEIGPSGCVLLHPIVAAWTRDR